MKSLALLLLLAGCASGRFLTPEEDQMMRETCPDKACTIVPDSVMEQMMKVIRGRRA